MPLNYEASRDFNLAYFNNNLNHLQVGLCEGGKRPWQKNIVLMTDNTSNSSSNSLRRLTHDSDNFTLCYPSHVSHFFTSQILGDFRRHVTSLNQGPFSGVRERTLGTRLRRDWSQNLHGPMSTLLQSVTEFARSHVNRRSRYKIRPDPCKRGLNIISNIMSA